MLLRVRDRIGPRERFVTQRRERADYRSERPHPDLEPDLIVALAGAAVGDGIGTKFARRLHERIGDQRARQRCGERILALIARVGRQRPVGVFGDEPLAHVEQHRIGRAQIERLFADGFERGLRAGAGDEIALAEVDRHRHNLVARFDKLLEQHGRIEAARVCQDDVHGKVPFDRGVISAGVAHVFETLHDDRQLGRVVDDHQDRVVAGERSEDLRPFGIVDRRCDHHRAARRRAQNDLVDAALYARDKLGNDAVQARGEHWSVILLDVLERAALTAFERDFHQTELFDIARDRSLRNLVALLLEQHRQLFLRAHRPGRDQRENSALPFGLG